MISYDLHVPVCGFYALVATSIFSASHTVRLVRSSVLKSVIF